MAAASPSPIRRALSWFVLSLVLSAAWLASGSAPAAATPLEIAKARSPGIDIRVRGPHNAVVRRIATEPVALLEAGSSGGGQPAVWADADSRSAAPGARSERKAKAPSSLKLIRKTARIPAAPRAPPHSPIA